MNNPHLNTVLKWSIENSSASESAKDGPKTQLSEQALEALFDPGAQKSEAELMTEQLGVAANKEAEMHNRVQAFKNFRMIIEQLDNANMMEPLGLWTSLIEQLESEHAEMRLHAAWCCAVAVQNNLRTQERLLIVGAIPILMRLATEDTDRDVRKKAATALSSTVRNFQPGLDAAVEHAPAKFKPQGKLDASDMESCDVLIGKLRESI